MKIRLNGELWPTEAKTLADLLAELAEKRGLDISAVATAVNGEFAPAAARAARSLADGDAVEIVSPRQGG